MTKNLVMSGEWNNQDSLRLAQDDGKKRMFQKPTETRGMEKYPLGQTGAALIVALIMLLVLTLMGIMALDSSRHEVNIVGNQRIYNAAFYAAESGLDEFRTAPPLSSPAYRVPFTGPKNTGTSGNSYRYKSDRIALKNVGGTPYHVFIVTAEGTAPNFPNAGRATIEAVIEVYSGGGGPVDEVGRYN